MKIYYLYPVTTKPANHETLKLAPIRLVCNIYRSKSYHSRQKYGTISDNTSLPFEYPLLEQVGPTTNFPGGILFSDDDWISAMSPNDTLRLFIFQDDIVDNYGWEKVHDDYMILVRYDLSKEDIQRLNADIHYPPIEEMRDVHMYPPYEEVIENYNRMISEKE